VDTLNRLESRIAAGLCHVVSAFIQAGLPYAIIGANALILQGINLDRSTRDLDIAVTATGGLGRVREIMVEAGMRTSRIAHRFSTPSEIEVDVLPLDPSVEHQREIQFPDGERLSAVGLADAVRHSVKVDTDHCIVNVAALPILVALKLHAATRRPGELDLRDAFAAMDQYVNEGTRRFDLDYVAHPELAYETAGAFLLGLDLLDVVEEDTLSQVLADVQTLLADDRLSEERELGIQCAPLLHAFRLGLKEAGGAEVRNSASID